MHDEISHDFHQGPNLAEKSAPCLKLLRVTAQGAEGHLTHTVITSLSYSTISLKVVPTNLGLFSL